MNWHINMGSGFGICLRFGLLCAVLIAASCKTTQLTKNPEKFQSKEEIWTYISQMDYPFEWFSCKFNVDIESPNQNNSFKVALRMRKDSVIWISVTPMVGIEVMRLLITPDSICTINRLKGVYTKSDVGYLDSAYGLGLDFGMLQNLLIGKPIQSVDDQEYRIMTSKDQVVIGNTGKNLTKKIDKDKGVVVLKKDKDFQYLHQIIFSKNQKKWLAEVLLDPVLSRSFSIHYLEFDSKQKSIPIHQEVLLHSDQQSAKITLKRSRMEWDEELSMPFKVSKKYDHIVN